MKISTKGRYGARAALELALRYNSGPIMVKEIARSQNISDRYLEHILNALRTSGIVKSTRGARGGYELSKKPSSLTVGEVVRCLEGPMEVVSCTKDCTNYSLCATCEVWDMIKKSIDEILDSVTYEDLVQRHYELKRKRVQEYVI